MGNRYQYVKKRETTSTSNRKTIANSIFSSQMMPDAVKQDGEISIASKKYQYARQREAINVPSRKKLTNTILSTMIIPQIATDSGDIFILTKDGDRLDRLAYLYYEDSSLWWYIAKANNLGKGTWAIPIGTILRIPAKVDSELTLLTELQQYNEQYR